MKPTARTKKLIFRVLSTIEGGSVKGNYSALVEMNDGKNDRKQVTYGVHQTTEDSGGLLKLLRIYIRNGGMYACGLSLYVDRIVRGRRMSKFPKFKALLIEAGKKDPIMRSSQDEYFDRFYWNPAVAWMTKNGCNLPLGLLIVYDAWIQSGGIKSFLRRRFKESPPAKGGTEKAWMRAYVETRHKWLTGHSRKVVRNSAYRTRMLLEQIEKGNWRLKELPIMVNGRAVNLPQTA